MYIVLVSNYLTMFLSFFIEHLFPTFSSQLTIDHVLYDLCNYLLI